MATTYASLSREAGVRERVNLKVKEVRRLLRGWGALKHGLVTVLECTYL